MTRLISRLIIVIRILEPDFGYRVGYSFYKRPYGDFAQKRACFKLQALFYVVCISCSNFSISCKKSIKDQNCDRIFSNIKITRFFSFIHEYFCDTDICIADLFKGGVLFTFHFLIAIKHLMSVTYVSC